MKNTKINKRILIFTIILFIGILLFPHFSSAKEVLATGLSPANIRAAVNSASPGDTVVLPAGDVGSDGSWNVNQAYSAAVVIPAGISLRGQGVDETIIRQTAGYYAFFYFKSLFCVHFVCVPLPERRGADFGERHQQRYGRCVRY